MNLPRCKSPLNNPFTIIWLLFLIFGLTIFTILATRIYNQFDYRPVLLASRAGPPFETRQGLNLHDGVTVTQRFDAPAAFLTHLDLGINNLRSAPADSQVHLNISSDNSSPLIQLTQQVTSLASFDYTSWPMNISLDSSQTYTLSISTTGIPPSQALSLFYNAQDETLGSLARQSNSQNSQPLSGSLGLRLMRKPTFTSLLTTIPTYIYAALGLYLLLLIAATHPRLRRRVIRLTNSRLPLETAPTLCRRELIFVTITALALAFTITLPFYTNLHLLTNQHDIHTAMIYRALGRDSLAQNQELALWDPYQCGGRPLLANLESAHLSPLFPLVFFFGPDLGVRLSVTATLMLSFIGAYLAARRMAHSDRLPSLLTATVFTYSGFTIYAITQGFYAWLPLGLVPWAIWLFWESLKRPPLIALSALTTAFLFLGGSIHMTFYTIATIILLAISTSLTFHRWQPILNFIMFSILTILLSAIKLIPALELHAITGRFQRPLEFLTPINWAWQLFTDRSLINTTNLTFAIREQLVGPDQYAFYVGLIPVILFIASLWWIRSKQLAALLAATAIFLLMTFALWPWTWLGQLPLLDEILRNPQRARFPLVLLAGLIMAYGLTRWSRILRKPSLRHLVVGTIVTLVIADLLYTMSPLIYRVYDRPLPPMQKQTNFTRFERSFASPDEEYFYRATYINYLQHEGTTSDGCINYLFTLPQAAVGKDSSNPLRPYLGEAHLIPDGHIKHINITPNYTTVDFQTHQSGLLILNQNYHAGWQTTPPREVVDHQGLLAARITSHDQRLAFHYRPLSYTLGKIITWTTILLLLLWFVSHTPGTSGKTSNSPSNT